LCTRFLKIILATTVKIWYIGSMKKKLTKRILFCADDEFRTQIYFLQMAHGLDSMSQTIRRVVEREYEGIINCPFDKLPKKCQEIVLQAHEDFDRTAVKQ
jgi:transcriptional regulatory protein LevR